MASSAGILPGPAPAALLGLTGLSIDGGIASVSRCIVRALDECTSDGLLARSDRVLLLEDPGHGAPPPRAGEQRVARGNQVRFVWELWRSWRRYRHGLVLFDHVGLARSVHVPLPSLSHCRYAVFVHGFELNGLRGGARTRALLEARTILANSEFTARMVCDRYPSVGSRVRVVPLCLDPDRIHAWGVQSTVDPRAPRERSVLMVGRMASAERGKGHDALIEAWSTVRREASDAELWIVGGGDDVPRLEAKARAMGVSQSIRFLGRIEDAELSERYRRAAVFAMPSRQEGFGLVYAEAMWHGLPCIGSTADAAGQVIVDGETGLLVPYGDPAPLADAIIALLKAPERAARMGEAGRRRAVVQFGYERFRRDLLSALDLA